MMRRMRKALLTAVVLMSLCGGAFAADDDVVPPDARTEGYHQDGVQGAPTPLLITPATGTIGTWAITTLLGVVCIGVMFKNGKRSHLD